MQTDVRSLLVAASATDTVVGGTNRNRLKALTISYAATGGTVVVKDGAAGSVTLFSYPPMFIFFISSPLKIYKYLPRVLPRCAMPSPRRDAVFDFAADLTLPPRLNASISSSA